MKNRFLPILLLLLAMGSIQYGASVAKGLFPLAGVMGASSLRLFFAAIILAAAFRPWRAKLNRAAWKSLFFYGASLGLMNLSFYYSLERIPLGIAVALEFTGPLAVAILAGQNKLDFLWAFMAGLGIYLLLPLKENASSLDPFGMGFALLAGLFWALYILFGKKVGAQVRSSVAASFGMAIAALVVVPWGLSTGLAPMLQPKVLQLGAFVGLFGSAIPYSLEMTALKRMPSKTFSILMSMEPAVASLMGFVFLSEELSPKQWLAIACVIVASQGSSLKRPLPIKAKKKDILPPN